jgi:hypothetical protein
MNVERWDECHSREEVMRSTFLKDEDFIQET